ncbi:hypothetical protein AGR2A_pa40103 [Agrobacterium genomosp. 2 str. CFBP 5494]|uniref:Uncharacterized protein n=1 Tax=Agrobacterium genomosp. 2 str. CFBP 5494 TaxID=1183436 RepID=A0A9W5F351_9HYPH|nr:hypothetical protein AGR2A_pa40103 [Agrobacterium genomosp. 2 str. CFBP 5494]
MHRVTAARLGLDRVVMGGDVVHVSGLAGRQRSDCWKHAEQAHQDRRDGESAEDVP